jgi:hypothetical protein
MVEYSFQGGGMAKFKNIKDTIKTVRAWLVPG